MRATPGRLLIALFVVVAVTAIATGLAIIGPPWVQRELAIDQHRSEDLDALHWAIEEYWYAQDRLPETLADLGEEWSGAMTDPETGAPYEYEAIGARDYRLCATFTHDAGAPDDPRWMGDFEMHRAGRHCFSLEVPAE